jgi:predicted nuclease of predicted toxin-antitoxin system
MNGFLIDANLPSKLRVWQGPGFTYVISPNDQWTDTEIWEYARDHKLTIITKDADFSHRMIVSKPPPRIIHIKVGNLKLREFEKFIEGIWKSLVEISEDHKLVNVFPDRIEAVE